MAAVPLPVTPPLGPMLAKSVKTIPSGDYLYEPKWDGFRCIAFRDGDKVELASRGEKPLTRYFPEVVEALRANLPQRAVVEKTIEVFSKLGGTLVSQRRIGLQALADDALQTPRHVLAILQ